MKKLKLELYIPYEGDYKFKANSRAEDFNLSDEIFELGIGQTEDLVKVVIKFLVWILYSKQLYGIKKFVEESGKEITDDEVYAMTTAMPMDLFKDLLDDVIHNQTVGIKIAKNTIIPSLKEESEEILLTPERIAEQFKSLLK